jgi:hypothetical protein
MADTSSKIKIGAFFNNALAIAILCKYKKINQSFRKLYLPVYIVSEVTHVVRGVCSISSLSYGGVVWAYLPLTATKKTSSLSYHSVIALHTRLSRLLDLSPIYDGLIGI